MTNSIPTRGGDHPRAVVTRPQRVWAGVFTLVLIAAPAIAQPAKKPPPTDVEPANGGAATAPKGKPKVFDFTGLDISGRLRTPQLLYFLDRATEELERASLERRSFIPEMVRSVDEGPL
jgi:hypothetical protein